MPDKSSLNSLYAIILTNFIVGIAVAMFFPVIPLRLDQMGWEPMMVGLNSATSPLAVLLTMPFAPRILRNYNLGDVNVIVSLLFALCVVIMGLIPDYWVWLYLRLVIGFAFAISWIAIEYWVSKTAPEHLRGRIIALYVTGFLGGTVVGPLLLERIGTAGSTPFFWIAGLMVLSAIPVFLVRNSAPTFGSHADATIRAIFKFAPRLLIMGVGTGITAFSLISMFSYYGVKSGLSESSAILLTSVSLLGGLTMQMPVGWLADKIDRMSIYILLASTGVIIAILFHLFIHEQFIWVLAFLYGACVHPLYSLALSNISARFAGTALLTAANAGYIFAFEMGNMISGPTIGGMMEIFNGWGFAITISSILAILAVIGIVEKRRDQIPHSVQP